MDLDLSEYDQVDEIKLIMDNHEHRIYTDGASSNFLETLSSFSDQASLDETNCENDFVFLPAPSRPNNQPPQQFSCPATSTRSQAAALKAEAQPYQDSSDSVFRPSATHQQQQVVNRPLITINSNNGDNPFGNRPPNISQCSNKPVSSNRPADMFASKPTGLLEVCSAIANCPNIIMQQIAKPSDLVYIAIPCAYCHEPIACPPSDISSWLNHMNRLHNCRVCPMCNKMIGLGPRRDIDIMRRHVIEHLDDDWLERRATKASFTYGLQQQWFSGNRCAIKDPRCR